MTRSLRFAVLLALVAGGARLYAQDPAREPATPAGAAAQDAGTAAGSDTTTAGDEDAGAEADDAKAAASAPAKDADTTPVTAPDAAPRKPAAATGSPQRFEPTEKVRPDFDVAFPVDI